jgi:hypothetical protein
MNLLQQLVVEVKKQGADLQTVTAEQTRHKVEVNGILARTIDHAQSMTSKVETLSKRAMPPAARGRPEEPSKKQIARGRTDLWDGDAEMIDSQDVQYVAHTVHVDDSPERAYAVPAPPGSTAVGRAEVAPGVRAEDF